jgi:alkyl sulfatase BDS1-like metallo-beta-lactamase superfamily hydrolase
MSSVSIPKPAAQPKPASPFTKAANGAVTFTLDDDDFTRINRGLIAQIPTGQVMTPSGTTIWDITRYDFLADPTSPDTVNPSLWRQARLNVVHGLFEVAPGVWQARGYDISNVTFIAGTTGWVVIDPLTSEDCARACLALANEHLGERPVTAVIYTHSHADHFGGVFGVTTQADVDAGRCQVIAPVGFLHEAVSENLLAGPAMLRRSLYQFGPLLPASPQGHVDCGLGKSIPTQGASMLAPNVDITHTGQELVVDGVRIVFQLTPETEAPAEMNFFFPDHGWLCMAENCTHTMHNLVPIRGAKVRDALAWSKYIDEALNMFGNDVTLLFASHHWPRWDREDVCAYLLLQRDLYRWMHDQTLRAANHGRTPNEIASDLTLPAEFLAHGHTRGYYGDLIHNAKAVYQRYLSWYDANPVHLQTYAPTDLGARYVDILGGADAAVGHAQRYFDQGDYRFVVELLNHVVFSHPNHVGARELQADAMEQLGYQAESSTFRNAYLMGAQELRQGVAPRVNRRNPGLLRALTVEQFFELLGVRLKSENVGGLHQIIAWNFTDVNERWELELSNRSLHSRRINANSPQRTSVASVTTTRAVLISFISGQITMMDAVRDDQMTITGDAASLVNIFGNLDMPEPGFAIVEP